MVKLLLKEKISTDLYNEFAKAARDQLDRSMADPNGADSVFGLQHANISKVMFRLKETSFKANIMTECSELFYDKDRLFLDKLDWYIF